MMSSPAETPDERFQKTLGEALRRARDEAGLRQTDVATRCRMSAQTLTNMKTGAHKPSVETVRGLVDGLGEFGFDAWSALGFEPPVPGSVPVTASPSGSSLVTPADEVLAALVDAADDVRVHGVDLVAAWRRAETHVRRLRQPPASGPST
jgi:transcriptional regulator with XRE-family HTH domain